MDTHSGTFKERIVLVTIGSVITGVCVVIAAAVGILNFSLNSQNETSPTAQPESRQVIEPKPSQEQAVEESGGGSGSSNLVGITAAVVDEALGAGNWFCLDGSPNGVKVKKLPSNFVVEYPFFQVDEDTGVYTIGQSVPGGGPATGWLQDNLLDSGCLTEIDDSPLTREEVNAELGSNNWHCINGPPNGFKILDVPNNFIVQYPLIAIDK